MSEKQRTNLGNPSSEAPADDIVWRHSSAIFWIGPSASGRGPGLAPGWQVEDLARFCSRPIFDSPEPNSSVSDDDTQPPSSHPIRRPAESPEETGAGSKSRRSKTWDRIAPGVWFCSLGLVARVVGCAHCWMFYAMSFSVLFSPKTHTDKMNEYGRMSHPNSFPA